MTDTVKLADERGFVQKTLDRAFLWSMQTPQCFRYSMIREAYDILIRKEEALISEGLRITDDAMVIETVLRRPVKIVEGSYKNIKITIPEDLTRAEIICRDGFMG